MTGILIKDLYNTRKQLIWYIAMIAVFFVLSLILKNIAFISTISLLATVSVPMTAIAYEEKESWQKFIAASGTDIKAIIFEKYLLGIVFAIIGNVLYAIAFFVGRENGLAWIEFVLPVSMSFIVLAAVLPLIFKFGVEKGRAFIIAIVVVMMLIWIGVLFAVDKITGVSEVALIAVCVSFAAIALVASIAISVRIYRRKEF